MQTLTSLRRHHASRKSIFSLSTCFVFLIFTLCGAAFAPSAAEAANYTVANAAQLAQIAVDVNNGTIVTGDTITLTTNIDLSSPTYTPWTPIGRYTGNTFNGTFDGGGFTISGLTVNTSHPTESVYAGLFGHITGTATIKDLNVVVVSVRAEVTATTMTAYAGGVVGYNDSGTVSNCHVSGGTISAEYSTTGSYNAYAGGVAGYSYNGTISKCYVSDGVTVKSVGNWNQVYAGGVLGFGTMAVIEECFNAAAVFAGGDDSASAGGVTGGNNSSVTASYNAGSVTASINGSSTSGFAYAGGVAGYSGGTISNCANIGAIEAASAAGNTYAGGILGGIMNGLYTSYSAGTVSATGSGGTNNAGGLLAYNAAYYESMGLVQNSFYDNEKAPGTLADSAVNGITTTQMKTPGTYTAGTKTDWGDTAIWTLQDGYYPVLASLAHTLTVDKGTGDGSYMPGTTVTVKADAAPAGWEFDGWTSDVDVAFVNSTSETTEFKMPASNATVTANYVSSDPLSLRAPRPTPPGGSYSGSQNVVLETTTPGAEIYYTTNEDLPAVEDKIYSGPIPITANTTIRAVAAVGGEYSLTMVASYAIRPSETSSNVDPSEERGDEGVGGGGCDAGFGFGAIVLAITLGRFFRCKR